MSTQIVDRYHQRSKLNGTDFRLHPLRLGKKLLQSGGVHFPLLSLIWLPRVADPCLNVAVSHHVEGADVDDLSRDAIFDTAHPYSNDIYFPREHAARMNLPATAAWIWCLRGV